MSPRPATIDNDEGRGDDVTGVEQAPNEVSPRPRQEMSRRDRERSFFRHYGLQAGTVVMAVVIWVILAVGAPETWLHCDIYSALMSTVPQTGIIALTLTLVVIARRDRPVVRIGDGGRARGYS